MSDTRTMIEFREDLERGVPFPDFAAIEKRGRSVRRRRQIVPTVVAIAAVGVGLLSLNVDRHRDELQPAPSPTLNVSTQPPSLEGFDQSQGPPAPGDYSILGTDHVLDAEVTLVGTRWAVWRAGGFKQDATGAVSWALDEYEQLNANPCLPDTHPPATRAQIIQMVMQIPRVRITQAAQETQILGSSATHIGFSTLASVPCPQGTVPYGWESDFKDPRVKVDLWAVDHVDQTLLLIVTTKGDPTAKTLDELDRTVASIQLASS
jgi:hypothetical protein